MKKIRILHIVSALDTGGVERILYNYIKNIIDYNNLEFEFIVHNEKEGELEKELKQKGYKIYHVTPKKNSILKNILQINQIIKRGNYDIVHCHQNFSSFVALLIARINKVKIRIIHSHGYNPAKNIMGKVKEKVLRFVNKKSANYYFSCGEKAAEWLFGKNIFKDKHFYLMPNAIDIEKFEFQKGFKDKISNIGKKKKTILHIGRFSPEKNHEFLIDIMDFMNKTHKNQYQLILVGEGSRKQEIQKIVKEKKLEDNIFFLGVCNNVSEIMSASDIFLLPSKNEGFPVTLVEAQASGLSILCSDNISKEVQITDLIKFLPIKSPEIWGEEIYKAKILDKETRKKYNEKLKGTKYDIKAQSKKYVELLNTIIEEEENK